MRKRACTATLSDLYTSNLFDLGVPTRSIKTPARKAIREIEVHNPPLQKCDSTRGWGGFTPGKLFPL